MHLVDRRPTVATAFGAAVIYLSISGKTNMQVTDPLSLSSDMLEGAKSYLRIEDSADDNILGHFICAAIARAEAHCGQIIIRRTVRETIAPGNAWQVLATAPIVGISSAIAISSQGVSVALAADAWEARVSSRGEGYVRILRPGDAARVDVTCIAGFVAQWTDLHEGLRLALLRLTAHFYANRDDAAGIGLPAAVTALLNPWRRVRL